MLCAVGKTFYSVFPCKYVPLLSLSWMILESQAVCHVCTVTLKSFQFRLFYTCFQIYLIQSIFFNLSCLVPLWHLLHFEEKQQRKKEAFLEDMTIFIQDRWHPWPGLRVKAPQHPYPAAYASISYSSSPGHIIPVTVGLPSHPSCLPAPGHDAGRTQRRHYGPLPVDYSPPRHRRVRQEAARRPRLRWRGRRRWWRRVVVGERRQGALRVAVPQFAQRGRAQHTAAGKDAPCVKCQIQLSNLRTAKKWI